VYDWDSMMFNGYVSYLSGKIELCFSIFPCALEIHGNRSGSIERIADGSISCLSSAGCIAIILVSLNFVCKDNVPRSSMFVIQGSTLKISYVSFNGCFSDADGGIVKAYAASTLLIDHSYFEDIHSLSYGGAIALLGSHAYISHTGFRNCSAVHGGGAIWAMWASVFQCYDSGTSDDTILQIDMSTFALCSSSGPGGSILATSDSRSLSANFGSFLVTYTSGFSVENILVNIRNTVFSGSKSDKEGGALAVSSLSAVVQVFDTIFSYCSSASNGGAVYAGDHAKVNLSDSVFYNNSAYGIGGGAVYSQNAKLMILNVTSTNNSAFNGGGGVLFWEGNFLPLFSILCSPFGSEWPLFSKSNILSASQCYARGDRTIINSVAFLLETIRGKMCGPGNTAVYGQCIASDYKTLQTTFPGGNAAYPGLSYSAYTLKKDAYNQTITTDSASIIQVFQSNLHSTSDSVSMKITGNSIVRMYSGVVMFSLAISPVFSYVDFRSEATYLLYQPDVFISGTDSQTSLTMQTEAFRINFHSGRSVCPKGYILDFDVLGSKNGSASCSFCKTGTYSVNPLAPSSGSLSSPPSCLNCPTGGDCSLGGYKVIFEVGKWIESDRMFILVTCPQGYQLINSSGDGRFYHGLQECKQCQSGQYIINPNLDSCHFCPEGRLQLVFVYKDDDDVFIY
jgi:hypothetical protein